MEAGHVGAGVSGGVGQHTITTRDTGHVRGRRLALLAGAVIAAFGGAFAVGAATSTKAVAPARLAPAVNSAGPAALKISVKPSVSVPILVREPKAKAKPKPATVASPPVVVTPAPTAPVAPPAAPVVANTGGTAGGGTVPTTVPPSTQPTTISPPPPPTTISPPPPASTGTSSGTGTVSGSG